MRRLVVLAAAAALLAACSGEQPTAESSNTTELSPQASSAVELPPDPEPAAEGPCPYLETDYVSRANGQRVARVMVSDEKPYPACFFYRPDGGLQLTVRVYVGEAGIATALVDKAAPVDTSNPTGQPPGWKGGYESTDKGAVYAVSKGDTAVIVSTNQQQSVKARSVATEAISALGT
ncbi:hypothetical protein FHU38_004823 [Saccharomonospora amisosensis]|uniref:DUF2020 domain-containing protein n=1 Tax=Saccharomonospora amisosensis TaxID=1128677 RepID=A0A7X5UV87_9PSEU|nr:DUF2020 domain-containing protein [Saccharomonospora amisosensis]NIJ14422.1 hypothetical protein [Saccharomonospora amisosensis]